MKTDSPKSIKTEANKELDPIEKGSKSLSPPKTPNNSTKIHTTMHIYMNIDINIYLWYSWKTPEFSKRCNKSKNIIKVPADNPHQCKWKIAYLSITPEKLKKVSLLFNRDCNHLPDLNHEELDCPTFESILIPIKGSISLRWSNVIQQLPYHL